MNFSTDRDLLALEPNVFNDAPLTNQRRLTVTDAVIAGTTLTSASADFAAAQVESASVVVVDTIPLEVIERVDANTLTVSKPRVQTSDAAIPPGDGSALTLHVETFAPQAALVHDALLRMMGLDPEDASAPVTEDAIISISLMVHLETLGTLERVYSASVALTGDNNPELIRRAELYRNRFASARERAVILLDADGDGRADTRLSLPTSRLVRN